MQDQTMSNTGTGSGAASEVAGTAKEQAREVAHEIKHQARSMTSDIRDRVTEQSRSQNERLSGTIRRIADELDEMASQRDDSPARTVVSRIASSGRQAADYLSEQGPEGVLREVQAFARRRPGAFVASALVAGIVVGRLGKSIWSAGDNDSGTSTGGTVGRAYGDGMSNGGVSTAAPTTGTTAMGAWTEPAAGGYATSGAYVPSGSVPPATSGAYAADDDLTVVADTTVIETTAPASGTTTSGSAASGSTASGTTQGRRP